MYLTVDIGGTKTFIALFDARGRIVKSDKFPTDHNLDVFLDTFFEHLQHFRDFCVQLQNSSNASSSPTAPDTCAVIRCAVIAIAGIVKDNRPTRFGNLPWQNPPLGKTIKNLFNCPIFFLNDADAACFYESNFYTGKSIYLTFSTGIGGGIATTKMTLDSASATFEPGHKKYNFNGKLLEWEDFAAASAIKKAYGNRDVTSLSGKSTYLDIALRVSAGLVDIINDYHPDTVIIGGPLSLNLKKWRQPLKIILKSNLKTGQKLPKIRRAKRPNLCVSYGAYLYGKAAS